MRRVRIVSSSALRVSKYYRYHGVSKAEVRAAVWSKSSVSNYNGSCFEIARLRPDRIGVRDTKDNGAGPILVFTQQEWVAFVGGVKAGEFDSL